MVQGNMILTGQFGGRKFRRELDRDTMVLGRAPDCDLIVPEPAVSRRHAEIQRQGGQYVLRDLGSSNGTRVNGALVDGTVTLQPGDRITLAKAELTVVGGSMPGSESSLTTSLTYADSTPPTGAEVSWREIENLRGGSADRRDRLFKLMAGASDLLAAAHSPEALYEPVIELVETAFTPERALLLLCDDPAAEPEVVAARVEKHAGEPDNIVLSKTVIRRVLTERVSLLIEDPGLMNSASAMQSIVAAGIRAAMAVPLVDEGRVAGLLYADTTRPAVRYTREDLKAFSLLAGVVGTAFTHARYEALEKEKQRLDAELDTARSIMATILPAELPKYEGYELWAHLDSCTEVGGDLYDLVPLDDGRLLVVAGDVTGKGLGAALLVSSIVPLLRTLVETERDPVALVKRLNSHLWRTTDSIRFATLFLGMLDPGAGRMEYVNAGHNPPYIIHGDGELETLASTGPPVGMLEQFDFGAATVDLAPSSTLLLYSDGISEAGTEEEFYGEGRFEKRLKSLGGLSATEIGLTTLADLNEFLDGEALDDDVTLVLVRRD